MLDSFLFVWYNLTMNLSNRKLKDHRRTHTPKGLNEGESDPRIDYIWGLAQERKITPDQFSQLTIMISEGKSIEDLKEYLI